MKWTINFKETKIIGDEKLIVYFCTIKPIEKVIMSTETLFEEEIVEEQVAEHNLIVFNDDVNTFDHVIESLIKICKHDAVQAEQCTTLIHYKGKCDVKTGEFDKLASMCTGLLDRGLSAEVQ